jgi:hypothetical protein
VSVRFVLVAILVALATARVAPSLSRAEATTVPPGTWYTLTFVDRIESGISYAVAPYGSTLLAGLDPYLLALDISDPANPRRISSINLDGAIDIAVQGDLAYVANGDNLIIVDVSDPANLVPLGMQPSEFTVCVAVADTIAVVGDHNKLRVVDVSDPTAPTLVGIATMIGASPWSVAISGQYAFSADFLQSQLRVVDISNPAAPFQVTHIGACTSGFGVDVNNNQAYVSTRCGGLAIFEVSSPSTPSLLGGFDAGWDGHGVVVRDDVAYLLCSYYFLYAIDVSNPSTPAQLSVVDDLGGYDLASQGDCLYAADQPSSFRIFDVSNAATPVELGRYQRLYRASGVHAVGDLLYVGERFNGFRVIDLSDPHAPRFVGSWSGGDWVPTSYCVRGTDLFIGTRNWLMDDNGSAFCVIDVSDPVRPRTQSYVYRWDYVRDVTADDQYLYGVGWAQGGTGNELFIYDVSDRSHPVHVSTLLIGASGLEVRNDLLYAAAWSSGLLVLDVSDRADPQIVGTWDGGSNVMDVLLDGPYAFVVQPDSGLSVIAVVRPDAPTRVARLSLPGNPNRLSQSGRHLVVSGYSNPALSVVDISDPLAPVAVAEYAADNFSRAAVLDTFIIGTTEPTRSLEILGAGFLRDTEVAVQDAATPAPFALRAYPNPFGTAATIAFDLPRAMEAEVTVFDAAGRAVRVLRRGVQASGTNRIEWDGRDDAGQRVASGVYFVRVRAEVGTVSRKLVILK